MRQTIPKITDPTTNGKSDDGSAGMRNGEFGMGNEDAPSNIPHSEFPIPHSVEGSSSAARRRRWRILLAIGVVAAVALTLGLFLLQPAAGALTATVQRGSIVSSVETTGKLEAETSAKLAFKASGRVATVFVKQGDRVKAGEALAELDTSALKRQLDGANTQLQISQLKVQQAKEGGSEDQVAAAQANLDAAQANLNSLKSGPSKEDLEAAQAGLDAAQAKLDALKKGASPQDITIAQAKLDQAKANRDLVTTTYANTTEQARITMDQAASANQNWLDPEGQYEQARLNYEAAQKNEQSQVAIADGQVVQAQAALDQLKLAPSAQDLNQAEDNVTLARANLDKLKNGPTPDDLKAAQAKVDAAQASLDSIKGGASSTDLAILEKQVALAQLSVDDVSAQLADASLTSPIDGTVLSIGLDVGETVGGYQQVATVADTGSLRVNASVDEIDVGRVTAGQAVTVTLDAYPGDTMPGKIDEIAPGATQNQGSTDYQATISFTPGQGVVPREGMAANVDITAQRKDNVLLLPNRAFETVGNRQYVTLQQNGTTTKVEVQTGLSNNSSTEVLSGLSEGQVVVLH